MGVSSSNIPGSDLDTTDSAGIRGGTNATIIGNEGDRLKVDLTGQTIIASTAFLGYSSYSPDPGDYPLGQSFVSGDYSDQMKIRGQVLTDEGSFRDDFDLKRYPSGVLYRTLAGTPGFKASNVSLGGSGTAYTTEMKSGQYVKKTSDAETLWTQIDSFDGDASALFTTPYAGTTANVSGVISDWKTLTPVGASLTTANSLLAIAPGSASGNLCGIIRQGDYLPYTLFFRLSLSQRIGNQTAIIGFQDDYLTTNLQAVFVFDGTSNTSVKCRSSCSTAAADIQETTVSIPSGNTSTLHRFSVFPTQSGVKFYIDGSLVAEHTDHIPGAYDSMSIVATVKNTAVVTATTVSLDWISWSNVDQLEVTNGFGEDFVVRPTAAKATYGATTLGLVAAASATDILVLTGSATKTIRLKKLRVVATQTTGAVINVVLVKRSTDDTAGTSTVILAPPLDSVNAAATAVVRQYTANPTLGTSVGNVLATKLFVPATTATPGLLEVVFGNIDQQEIVLRGVAQIVAVNLNGTTVSGSSFNITIEWTEES